MNSQATSAVDRTATKPPTPSHRSRRPSVLGVVCLASLVVFAYFAFIFAPEDAMQGSTQRIFYIHVPSAWISFVGFAVVFGSSIAYLTKRSTKADRLAEASATIGLLFTTVVLVTGMMWGRAIWGVYWTWDPRLTSYLVLWLLYLAYIALRSYVPDPERKARFSAILGIIAFLDVPIVYLSVLWWRTLHPHVFGPGGGGMPGQMLAAMFVGLITFTLVFVYLVRLRLQVGRLAEQVEEVQS
jgi:heme exporter protein C